MRLPIFKTKTNKQCSIEKGLKDDVIYGITGNGEAIEVVFRGWSLFLFNELIIKGDFRNIRFSLFTVSSFQVWVYIFWKDSN